MPRPRRSLSASLLVLALATFLAGCSALNAPEDGAFLRLRNQSSYDLTTVMVESPGMEETFERIPAGATTEYRPVARVYRYAYFEATVGEKPSRLVPIDYVGETPLGAGRFTFVLSVTEAGELAFLGAERER